MEVGGRRGREKGEKRRTRRAHGASRSAAGADPPGPQKSLKYMPARGTLLSGARSAAALCAIAAVAVALAAAAAAAPAVAYAGGGGDDAHASAAGPAGRGGSGGEYGMPHGYVDLGEGADVLDRRWSIVDAAVLASLDKAGRDRILAIAGATDRPGEPIRVTVRAPDGSILSGSRAAADPDGSFVVELLLTGREWTADGAYSVTLFQAAPSDPPGDKPARPYADTVLVRMSGGEVLAGGVPAGAPLPDAAAGYENPVVLGAAWNLLKKVIVVPGGGQGGGDVLRLVAVAGGDAPGEGASKNGDGGGDAAAAPAGDAAAAPAGATVRIVAPTGLEIGRFDVDAGGAGMIVATVETDGSRWAQDGTYLIMLQESAGGSPAGSPAAPHPDVLPVDIFDGSVVVAPSARAAAGAPDGRDGRKAAGALPAALPPLRQWDIIDAVAVSDPGGMAQRVVIAGSTDRPDVPVHLRVSDPAGRVIRDSPLMPDRETGAFLADIGAAGIAWSDSGTYGIELEQRSRTGQVYYSDLMDLEAGGGGAVAPEPRLAGTGVPAAVAASYGDAELVAVVWTFIKEVRISAAGGQPGPYTNVVIAGRTADADTPVSVTITAPGGLGAPRTTEVAPRADGSFEADMSTSGPFWSTDGTYAVAVEQEGGPPFADLVLLDLRDGGIAVDLPPSDVDIAAAAALAGGGGRGNGGDAAAGFPPARIISLGEKWSIIDALVIAEDGSSGASGGILVVVGTTDIAGLPVQAVVDPPDGSAPVAAGEAMPDASGSVLVEVPVDPGAWGADGTYLLTVSQPGTRYADMYPVYASGGRVAGTPEFAGVPVPTPASGYDSARLLDLKWGLVDRADVEVAAGGSAVIVVHGTTERPKIPVAVSMVDPDGLPMRGQLVAPEADGSFEVRIGASGSGWASDGTYRITVEQGPDSAFTDLLLVDVADGAIVPEFGMLAPLALAVAVAAAVAAVAAASRLGAGGLGAAAAGMR